MVQVFPKNELKKGPIADVEFEGAPHGSGVSFFRGKLEAGKDGPPPHSHPYSETCIVLAGQVSVTLEGAEVQATAGDVVVIPPGTIHGFRVAGEIPLEMICIHASDRFQIDWPE